MSMQGWFNKPPTEKSIKKSKIASIVCIAIFVCSLILSIVFGVMLPKEKRIKEVDNTRFTAVSYDGGDEWMYATLKNIVRMDKDNDIIGKPYPLYDIAQENGINIGQIKEVYITPESDYTWVIGSNAENENKGFLFKLEKQSDGFALLESASFNGVYKKMVATQEYCYVLSEPDTTTMITRFDAEDIANETARAQGLLYTGMEDLDKNTMSVIPLTGTSILSVDFIDGYLYVLTPNMLIRMADDLSQNNYRAPYLAAKNAIFNDLKTQAEANLSEGEVLTKEQLDQITAQAKTQACAQLGYVGYDEGLDEATLPLNQIDYEKYCVFLFDGVTVRGGAYVAEQGKYYVITNTADLRVLDLAELTDIWDFVWFEYALEFKMVNGIDLYSMPKKIGSAMFYNRYTNKAYIIYEAKNKVSCIDFNDGVELEFTMQAEFEIDRVLQIGDNLYYTYVNRFKTKRADQTILGVMDIEDALKRPALTAGLIASIVVGLISAICSVIFILCWRKEGHIRKTKIFLKRVVKYKWVYISMIPSIILLFLFCYYPAIESIRLSFFEYSTQNPTMRWNNFENYKLIFENQYAKIMFENMFLYLAMDIVTSIGPPLVFAFFLTVMRNKGYSQLMRTLLFIPGVIPGIAGLLIWRVGIFEGVLPEFCGLFGGSHTFLESYKTTRFELLLIGFPYVGAYLIFYGGMMNIPDSYYEAAELEGIGIWKRFFTIDIPLVVPQIKYIFITNFIHSVQNFTRVDSVDPGGLKGTRTPIVEIYFKIQGDTGAYGEASAYATAMFIFLFFATALNLRKSKKDVEV